MGDAESSSRSFGLNGEALASLSDISVVEVRTKARGRPNSYCKIIKAPLTHYTYLLLCILLTYSCIMYLNVLSCGNCTGIQMLTFRNRWPEGSCWHNRYVFNIFSWIKVEWLLCMLCYTCSLRKAHYNSCMWRVRCWHFSLVMCAIFFFMFLGNLSEKFHLCSCCSGAFL